MKVYGIFSLAFFSLSLHAMQQSSSQLPLITHGQFLNLERNSPYVHGQSSPAAKRMDEEGARIKAHLGQELFTRLVRTWPYGKHETELWGMVFDLLAHVQVRGSFSKAVTDRVLIADGALSTGVECLEINGTTVVRLGLPQVVACVRLAHKEGLFEQKK